jgi:cellulose synthase (UDP-forming)
MPAFADQPDFLSRVLRILFFFVAVFFWLQFISLTLSWQNQAALGVAMVLLGLAADRLPNSRIVTLALMAMSILATFRYGWWRVATLVDYFSSESRARVSLNAFFILLLVSAEAYTILIMILGYMQTAWPLQRMPLPMPADPNDWPHVDLLIPTYNEPLSLVRYTALAAINIDYPSEKLHVYILDDGTRPDFAEFARDAGVGYITREQHSHAKAGNINHALTMMDSPFVAIFDCDHVPTRSYLQVTLGWMLADPKLAMLQTPHYFYSPDPFERNLLQYKTIPNEGELFYGIIQDGNDFWNATFFCGSCAILRRSILDEVGGIATETVTEDAHTSLRMQKHGYNTAYLNIRQAAGLATETLAAHVGQRIRWARGMIQILRTDNPLIGGKMRFTQRLCYLNAMLHFMYAGPRIIFLLSPLVYLFLGRTIIPGYWLAILVFALPHLVLASLTNSRVQGRHRHSFWNEIYEAVLAPYILLPTVLALLNPKLGKFNVTAKATTLERTQFDTKISTPTKWMLFANFIGIGAGIWRLAAGGAQFRGAILMNLAWVLFNIVILGVAAAVAYEQKQRRSSVRIDARIAIRITTPAGVDIAAESIDMSVGGASLRIRVPSHVRFAVGESLLIAFPEITGDESIPATVVGFGGESVRIAFDLASIVEQETLTRALYSRADAWLEHVELKEADRPLVSLGRVMVLSVTGLRQILLAMLPERPDRSEPPSRGAASTAALLLILGFFASAPRSTAAAQQPASIPRAAASSQPANSAPEPAPIYRQSVTFREMGAVEPIALRGPHSSAGLHLILSFAMVPHQARLHLVYAFDPSLDPHSTSLRVSLNDNLFAQLSPPSGSRSNSELSIDLTLPESLLVRDNFINFEFQGSGVLVPEVQAKVATLCRVFPSSTVDISGDWLAITGDLSNLPLPIFDPVLQASSNIPVFFADPPTAKTLQSAGVVASWFGLLSRARPPRFTSVIGYIPAGNGVLLSPNRQNLPPTLQLPVGSGPLVALRSNPADPHGSILILAADSEDELLSVAQALALSSRPGAPVQLTGSTALNPTAPLPPPRSIDDAPRWLPVSSSAPLSDCAIPAALHSDGSFPVTIYFHLPPDLNFGERQLVYLDLNYRYDAANLAPGSALRTILNGLLIDEIPLKPGSGPTDGRRRLQIPVESLRAFGNTINFSFDFIPTPQAVNQNAILSGDIRCDSSLRLSGLPLWAQMPDLELFSHAGYPFTRRADLAETTIVLPAAPTSAEVALFLHLLGHFGAQTGYPALRVNVAGPATTILASRDYLILGSISDQPAFRSLAPSLPATLDTRGVDLKSNNSPSQWLFEAQRLEDLYWSRYITGPAPLPSHPSGPADALTEEIRSPSAPDRSIVAIELASDNAAAQYESVFLNRSQSDDIAGSLALLRNQRFESFRLNSPAYHTGNLTWFALMRLWMRRHFLLLLLGIALLVYITARWAHAWMAWHARERLKISEQFPSEP